MIASGRPIIVTAHRRELLAQAIATMPPGVVVRSIQRLARGREPVPADLVVVDEAHRSAATSYRSIDYIPLALGLTATPHRLDGHSLGDHWDVMIECTTARALVDTGWLVEPTVYAPSATKLGRKSHGDYSAREQFGAVRHLTGDVVEHWERLGHGRHTLVFATLREHSRGLCSRFRERGHDAVTIDGTTPEAERLAAWSHQIVCTVDIATEGIDIPDLSCLVIARPTASVAKHLQMLGRVMRPAPGKGDAIVLDHAGNSCRLGMACDDRQWSLDHPENRTMARTDSPRVCSYCFAVSPPRSRSCSICGKPFPVERTRKTPRERAGELAIIREATNSIEEKKADYLRFLMISRERNYRPGWAYIQYRLRYGAPPPKVHT